MNHNKTDCLLALHVPAILQNERNDNLFQTWVPSPACYFSCWQIHALSNGNYWGETPLACHGLGGKKRWRGKKFTDKIHTSHLPKSASLPDCLCLALWTLAVRVRSPRVDRGLKNNAWCSLWLVWFQGLLHFFSSQICRPLKRSVMWQIKFGVGLGYT